MPISFISSKAQKSRCDNRPKSAFILLTAPEAMLLGWVLDGDNFDKMLKLQNDISLKKNKAMIGSVQSVLVEGESKTDKGRQCGRTEGGKLCHFASDKDLTGEIVNVKITDVNTWTLSGDMI